MTNYVRLPGSILMHGLGKEYEANFKRYSAHLHPSPEETERYIEITAPTARLFGSKQKKWNRNGIHQKEGKGIETRAVLARNGGIS